MAIATGCEKWYNGCASYGIADFVFLTQVLHVSRTIENYAHLAPFQFNPLAVGSSGTAERAHGV
jgi:hypothetical protein